MPHPSPHAARELEDEIAAGASPFDNFYVDEMQGDTDCEHGCTVEPDGECAHGYLSAARTLGIF